MSRRDDPYQALLDVEHVMRETKDEAAFNRLFAERQRLLEQAARRTLKAPRRKAT